VLRLEPPIAKRIVLLNTTVCGHIFFPYLKWDHSSLYIPLVDAHDGALRFDHYGVVALGLPHFANRGLPPPNGSIDPRSFYPAVAALFEKLDSIFKRRDE
jgi:hypothetical protein